MEMRTWSEAQVVLEEPESGALRKAEELLSRALPVPSTRRHVQLRLHQGTGPGPELPVKLLFGPRKCDRFVWVNWESLPGSACAGTWHSSALKSDQRRLSVTLSVIIDLPRRRMPSLPDASET